MSQKLAPKKVNICIDISTLTLGNPNVFDVSIPIPHKKEDKIVYVSKKNNSDSNALF